jgi:hypothetical protein
MICNYICVSGYGWTGSSACIDILKEFEGFSAPKGEFRIAKDPYGLRDLEESLVHDWDFIRNDIAIKDFLTYCEMLSRKSGLFKKPGKDFSDKLNVDFMKETHKYIEQITDMRYFGDTFVHRYKVSTLQHIFMRLRNKLGINNARSMYLARPSESSFLVETQRYIDNLFGQYVKDKGVHTIVLDQSVPPTNILNTRKYFGKMKVIIVDRDPRDVYVSMIKRNRLLGPELINSNSARKYIKWHKQLRRMSIKDKTDNKYVFRINFEDLVFKYDESIEKIINFLGGNIQHSYKGKYFNCERSIKNIGIWREHKDQKLIMEISQKLSKYCYK